MSASNQYIVRIAPRESFDKTHTYSLMHLDSLQKAMCNLKGESLKLWLYCNKNQDGYQFDLSQTAVQSWGLKKDAYQTAKKRMIELGYLVPISEDSNILLFYENPQLSEKPTIGVLSENQTKLSEKPIVAERGESEKPTKVKRELSEKPTIGESEMSEKPTTLSGFQTKLSEKAQRNNTIVHNSTVRDSTVADSGLPDKRSDSAQTDNSGLPEKKIQDWSKVTINGEEFVF